MEKQQGRIDCRIRQIDTRGMCPFLAEKNNVSIAKIGYTLNCTEGYRDNMRIVLAFKDRDERTEWKKRYCNHNYEDCPYYWIATEKYEPWILPEKA